MLLSFQLSQLLGKNQSTTKSAFFDTPFVNRQNLLSNIGNVMVQIQSRYFDLAFEQIFSDFPISRSSAQKMTNSDAYV